MKKCTLCGFENEDSVAFCTECGSALNDENAVAEETVEEVATEEITEVAEKTQEVLEETSEIAENDSEAEETIEETIEETTENVDGTDESIEEPAETEFIPEPVVKKPMSPAAKKSLIAVIIVLLAAVVFYCFGSLGLMSRIGIINSGRYINLVKNRQIQENEEAPAVKLGKAFDAFFVDENNSPVSKWSVSKADSGVEVKCETVCTFETQENTVATYKVVYDYSNNIASETFAAADKVLDQPQTESVLKKVARYSDPAKAEYTTKDISSSKYNNMNYYFPTGMSIEMVASMMYQMSLEDFLAKFYLPVDMEGSTDTMVAQSYFTLQSLAALSEITVDEVRKQLELDASVPETANYTEITDQFPLTKYGISEENIAELRKEYGFGEEVTPDTMYKDIKDKLTKAQYDMMEEQKKLAEEAEQSAKAEDEGTTVENTEALAETETKTE